jgi:hypothetical protein
VFLTLLGIVGLVARAATVKIIGHRLAFLQPVLRGRRARRVAPQFGMLVVGLILTVVGCCWCDRGDRLRSARDRGPAGRISVAHAMGEAYTAGDSPQA